MYTRASVLCGQRGSCVCYCTSSTNKVKHTTMNSYRCMREHYDVYQSQSTLVTKRQLSLLLCIFSLQGRVFILL